MTSAGSTPSNVFRRRDPALITPDYEDAGLFKNRICQVNLELTPLIYNNNRNDIVVTSFVENRYEIAVLFAGRRSVEAASLISALKTIKSAAFARAKALDEPPPDPLTLHLPVKMEGAWRPRFARDNSGWENKFHYFIASRWAVKNSTGDTLTFGEAPVLKRLNKPAA